MAQAPCESPGRFLEAKDRLHQSRGETRLTVQEEKGYHTHERREHHGQGYQGAQYAPSREGEPFE